MNQPPGLTHERRGDVLWVRFPEYETSEEARPFVDAALRLAEEEDASRVLIDTTANRIALSPLEYRRIGQYIARRPGASRLSIAIIRRPELVDEARQLEQWLSEQAFRYRVFADAGEAEAWLREGAG